MLSPTNYVKYDRSTDSSRTVKYRFPIEKISDTETRAAQVIVAHHPGQREFYAILRSVNVSHRGAYNVESYDLMGFRRLDSLPVGRYNAKKLQAFAEEVRETFAANLDDPDILSFLKVPAGTVVYN